MHKGDTPAEHLQERMIRSEEIYNGKILHITKDIVMLEDGKETVREVVHHPGGACALPLTEEGEVLMVRQFRYPHGVATLELPAGKLENGEDPAVCARRELTEETGYLADRFTELGKLYPTPAYDKEVISMYLAQGLHPAKRNLDEDEFLDVVRIPFEEAVRMVMRGEVLDAKTQIALLKAALLLHK